jgi:nucleoside-diphosphate-sugar epimerase
MAGTCAEYDWSRNGIFRESDACWPSTPYGEAKHALREALAASRRDSAWGIIFFPFGPHEPFTRLVPSVVRALLDGEPARCTHGDQVRDFLYVEDLGHGFATLLDSSVQGAVNLASGEGRSIRSLVEALRARLGGSVDYGALPTPAGDPASVVADVSRLRDELGWFPRIGVDVGLDRSVSWLRSFLAGERHPMVRTVTDTIPEPTKGSSGGK